MKSKIERLLADKDISVIEAIIALLRSRAPALVPTTEIGYVIRRPRDVYSLIKKARLLTSLTTGEFIPNFAKRKNRQTHGYTINKNNRAAEYEANKSFARAHGHIQTGIGTHRRVPKLQMESTAADIQLWLATESEAD